MLVQSSQPQAYKLMAEIAGVNRNA
jgi:hypothetical protein